MRARIVAFLTRLLRYLEAADARIDRVRELVAWAETLRVRDEEVTGERKRHQVLNRLVVEYPESRVKDLAFLIERVLQET